MECARRRRAIVGGAGRERADASHAHGLTRGDAGRCSRTAGPRYAPVRQRSSDLPPLRRRAPSASYCAGCHNGVMRSPSGALLDQFDTTRIAENPDVWTRAYRQLQAGTMPPVGARRPDAATYDAIIRSIETALRANVPPQADATSLEIAARLAAAPVGQRARRVAARGCAARPAHPARGVEGPDQAHAGR